MTNQGVELDRLPADQNRLEGLNAQTMQCRRTIEHYRVLLYNFIQHRPDFRRFLLNQCLGFLDVVHNIFLNKLLHDEGLIQLQSHLGREATLMHLQLGSDNDDGTAGVINTLSEKVLPEAPLLTLKHV